MASNNVSLGELVEGGAKVSAELFDRLLSVARAMVADGFTEADAVAAAGWV